MTKTIKGVPESITRAEYTAMIGGVGFDLNDLASLTFRADHIEAVVIDRDENGRAILSQDADGEPAFVKNTVIVRVEDENEEDAK